MKDAMDPFCARPGRDSWPRSPGLLPARWSRTGDRRSAAACSLDQPRNTAARRARPLRRDLPPRDPRVDRGRDRAPPGPTRAAPDRGGRRLGSTRSTGATCWRDPGRRSTVRRRALGLVRRHRARRPSRQDRAVTVLHEYGHGSTSRSSAGSTPMLRGGGIPRSGALQRSAAATGPLLRGRRSASPTPSQSGRCAALFSGSGPAMSVANPPRWRRGARRWPPLMPAPSPAALGAWCSRRPLHAARDRDHLTRDVPGGAVGGQECNRACHVGNVGDLAQRHRGRHTRDGLLGEVLRGHRRHGPARCDEFTRAPGRSPPTSFWSERAAPWPIAAFAKRESASPPLPTARRWRRSGPCRARTRLDVAAERAGRQERRGEVRVDRRAPALEGERATGTSSEGHTPAFATQASRRPSASTAAGRGRRPPPRRAGRPGAPRRRARRQGLRGLAVWVVVQGDARASAATSRATAEPMPPEAAHERGATRVPGPWRGSPPACRGGARSSG